MRIVPLSISLLIAALYIFVSLQNRDLDDAPAMGLAVGVFAAILVSILNFLWVHFILLAVSNLSQRAGVWLRRFYFALYVLYCGLAIGALAMMFLDFSWQSAAVFTQFFGLSLGLYAAFYCKIPWSERQIGKIKKFFSRR